MSPGPWSCRMVEFTSSNLDFVRCKGRARPPSLPFESALFVAPCGVGSLESVVSERVSRAGPRIVETVPEEILVGAELVEQAARAPEEPRARLEATLPRSDNAETLQCVRELLAFADPFVDVSRGLELMMRPLCSSEFVAGDAQAEMPEPQGVEVVASWCTVDDLLEASDSLLVVAGRERHGAEVLNLDDRLDTELLRDFEGSLV